MKVKEIYIVASVIALAVISLLCINLFRKPGESVEVRVNGEKIAEYSLSVDGIYVLNNGTNVLHIKGGKAWLDDAECPDKLCVKQGKISKDGQTITCLPNKLTIVVLGESDFVELEG